MKTKTTIHYIAAFFAYLMASSVLLAHAHAGDVVRHSSTKFKLQAVTTARVDDMHAKVMGDMHTHVDKAALKNVAATVAARRRMSSVEDVFQNESISEQIVRHFLLLRIMLTLPVGSVA